MSNASSYARMAGSCVLGFAPATYLLRMNKGAQYLTKYRMAQIGLSIPSMREQTEEQTNGREYRLEEQIGFALRTASQRHIAIFTANIPDLTPTQFAALAKTYEFGSVSQNELGRSTAMDAATVKGVIDRLQGRGLVRTDSSPTDRRRLLITLTDAGTQVIERALPVALLITDKTLAPLRLDERRTFLRLLDKLA